MQSLIICNACEMPLKSNLKIRSLKSCLLLVRSKTKREVGEKEVSVPFDHASAVLLSCVRWPSSVFSLLSRFNILCEKAHLIAFHIWKATSSSLHFPVGNGVVHQQRMIWDSRLPDFLSYLFSHFYNSPLFVFCSDGWNRFSARL